MLNHTILTAQEEKTLAHQGKKGHKTLVEHNLRLVASLTQHYQNRGLPYDDLFQEGVLGLMRATRTFDPSRARFTTYATWWIRRCMQRALQKNGKFASIDLLDDTPEVLDRPHPGPPEGLPEAIQDALNTLPKRDRKILNLRYLRPGKKNHTLATVGKHLNLSRERIRQLEKESFRVLSHNPALQEYATP